jgi:hypothetical protein
VAVSEEAVVVGKVVEAAKVVERLGHQDAAV